MQEGPSFTDVVTPKDFSEEINFALKDMFQYVIKHLQLSKIKMLRQYNKHLRYHDYKIGQKVRMKVKYYKTGENRKLSPRRNGPWVIVEKLPNGVNFKIKNENSNETTVVHHDRLSPVKDNEKLSEGKNCVVDKTIIDNDKNLSGSDYDEDYDDSSDSATFVRNDDQSNFETDSSHSLTDSENEGGDEASPRRYP